jgi:tetratricopeptide (TPR) repeat protein
MKRPAGTGSDSDSLEREVKRCRSITADLAGFSVTNSTSCLGTEFGEKWSVSGALAHVGSIYLGRGDYERATLYFQKGLALSREIGNKLAASTALYSLAMAAQGQGDHERAAGLYTEGLESATEAGDRANMAYCLDGGQGNLRRRGPSYSPGSETNRTRPARTSGKGPARRGPRAWPVAWVVCMRPGRDALQCHRPEKTIFE